MDPEDSPEKTFKTPLQTIVQTTTDNISKLHAEYFLPRDENGDNQWDQFLARFGEIKSVDAFDVSNHEQIIGFYNCKQEYLNKMKSLGNAPKTSLVKFRVLMYAVAQKKLRDKFEKGLKAGNFGALEGNTRLTAYYNLIMCAQFDVQNGTSEVGTLTKAKMAKAMALPESITTEEITERFKREAGEVQDWVDEMLADKSSAFHDPVKLHVSVGKTLDVVKATGLTMEDIAQLIRRKSQMLSEHKTESSIPAETVKLAGNLRNWGSLFRIRLDQMIERCEPTFSFNGRSYVQCDTKVKGAVPFPNEIGGDRLDSYVSDPTFANLLRYTNGITISQVKRSGKTFDQTEDICNPPAKMTVHSVASANGHYKPANEKRKQKHEENKRKGVPDTSSKSFVNMRIKSGEEHLPLGIEDLNKMTLIPLIHDSLYRASHKIPLKNWVRHPERSRCRDEIRFLIETHCYTDHAVRIGEPLEKLHYESKSWFESIGGNTVFSKGFGHLAATLFISETIIAILAVDNIEQGLEELDDFIGFIGTTHNDVDRHRDDEFVNILGESICQIFWRLRCMCYS